MAVHAPDVSEHHAETIGLPAIANGAGVLIVMNSDAGRSRAHVDPRPTIALRIPRAEVRVLDENEDLGQVVRQVMAREDPPAVLGVCGGDGSVSRMADLARQFDRPLFGIPGGTFNHFLRAAGVEDVRAAIDALQAGTGVAATVAELSNGSATRTVLNVVSAGIYPQFLVDRSERIGRLGKWLGGASALWRLLSHAQPIDIEIDGKPARVWSLFAGVGRHRLDRIALLRRDTLSDDVLDVRVVRGDTSRLRAVASLSFGHRTTALLHNLGFLPARQDVRRSVVQQLILKPSGHDPEAGMIVHDGELEPSPGVAGKASVLSLRVLPRALRVYAP